MKILSDFDGVMTDQTEEGHTEFRIFCDELARVLGSESHRLEPLLKRAEEALLAAPARHGWWSEGRLSAYADEDLFIKVIGTAGCLDAWCRQGEDELAPVHAALEKAGYGSFEAVSSWAYGQVVEHTRRGDIQPIDPAVRGVVMGLLEAGHEVVVVSNSATDRVLDLLSRLELPAVAHDDDPTAPLRVRGSARKFALGSAPRAHRWGELSFDVDRPAYRTILQDEKPQVVIGDVFSLDLALPLALCEAGELQSHLLLRTRPYTPAWARSLVEQGHPQAKLSLLHTFEDLPRLLGVGA